MELKHDPEADAIYVYLNSKPYAYGHDLDDERRIDYAADNSPVGVELLCVSRGVNIAGLPQADKIDKLLANKGIRAYAIESLATGYLLITGKKPGVLSGTAGLGFQYSFVLTLTTAKRAKGQARLHEEVTA